jgi:hypothetical protein
MKKKEYERLKIEHEILMQKVKMLETEKQMFCMEREIEQEKQKM